MSRIRLTEKFIEGMAKPDHYDDPIKKSRGPAVLLGGIEIEHSTNFSTSPVLLKTSA